MSLFTSLFALRKNAVARSVAIYTFTNFFNKGISFILLLFLFTKDQYIDRSDNGLLSLFSNAMLFLMPFLSMGILQSTSTDFFKLDKKEFRDFFTTSFVMPLIVMVLAFIVFFILREHMRITYGFPYLFIWLIPVITFLTFCNEQLISIIRNNNQPMKFLTVSISKSLIELGLAVVLIVFFAWRWKGRVMGIFTAYTISAIYALYYFHHKGYLFGEIRKKYIYSELVYAIPIIAMQVGVFTITASDKFFLSNFTNDHNQTVGVYSVACIFASLINVLCTALLQYLFPRIYTTLAAEKVDYGFIKRNFYYYLGVMSLGTIAILILIPLLYNWFISDKYHSALQYIYLVGIGYFLWAITYFFYAFLLYHKKKKMILFLSAIGIAVSLGSNYFFISRWGAQGAAVSVCASYLIVLIITLITLRRYVQQLFFTRRISIS